MGRLCGHVISLRLRAAVRARNAKKTRIKTSALCSSFQRRVLKIEDFIHDVEWKYIRTYKLLSRQMLWWKCDFCSPSRPTLLFSLLHPWVFTFFTQTRITLVRLIVHQNLWNNNAKSSPIFSTVTPSLKSQQNARCKRTFNTKPRAVCDLGHRKWEVDGRCTIHVSNPPTSVVQWPTKVLQRSDAKQN